MPACREFGGIDPPSEVVGMLPQGLLATFKSGGTKYSIELGGVVVVDSMPVPMHVSVMSLIINRQEGKESENTI
eukprot:444579-Rhodomonas_salina.4